MNSYLHSFHRQTPLSPLQRRDGRSHGLSRRSQLAALHGLLVEMMMMMMLMMMMMNMIMIMIMMMIMMIIIFIILLLLLKKGLSSCLLLFIASVFLEYCYAVIQTLVMIDLCCYIIYSCYNCNAIVVIIIIVMMVINFQKCKYEHSYHHFMVLLISDIMI
jgi:hypothetical protein